MHQFSQWKYVYLNINPGDKYHYKTILLSQGKKKLQ